MLDAKAPANVAAVAEASPPVACRGCHAANPSQRRFCSGCGQSLWETCPKCNVACPADERFCGSCGADIPEQLGDRSRQYQARLSEARELFATFEFDAASATLRGVAAVADPRFEQWRQLARTEIARGEDLRNTHQAAADQALTQARQHVQSHAYDAAAAELEAIPAPLRSPECRALLKRAHTARKELLALAAEIRIALSEKRTGDLLPKIERLLTLKPDHPQALYIAQQLRDGLVRGAKKHLAGHRYREALDLLDQVPSFVRSADVETLADTAGELAALFEGLQRAPLADRQTLALAERLVELVPDNGEAAKLRDRLAERSKSRPSDPRVAAPNWTSPPERTPYGAAVDGLAHWTRIPAKNEAVRANLAEHPGQLFVALGLALEGLGESAVPIDLTPRERGGMLEILNMSLGGRKSAVAAAWGLDLSDYALKAIKLAKDLRTGAIVVEACETILHARPTSGPDIDVRRAEAQNRTLRDFVGRAGDLKGARIAIGIPGQRVLGRFFELPPLPAKKVNDAIKFEARHQLPIPLEELCWLGQVQAPAPAKIADEQPRRAMVVAVRESHIRDRMAAFKAAGIGVDVATSDCVALHNAIAHEFFRTEPSSAERAATKPGAIFLLDVGTESTNVVVSGPHSLWFRTIGQGGDNVTGALVKQIGLTQPQAEQLKRDPSQARRYGPLCQAIEPLLVQMGSNVERSLANYAKDFPDQPVRQIYGLGGGFATHGLLRHLRFGR
ncbi:MAG: pilus assembly protein PilM [Pirellulaceae bacterium]